MNEAEKRVSSLPAILMILVGLLVIATAWMLPANLHSVTPGILNEAAKNTPQLLDLAQSLAQTKHQLGAATLVAKSDALLQSDRAKAPTPERQQLVADMAAFAAKKPALAIWGADDPFVAPLVSTDIVAKRDTVSTPVLEFFIAGKARESLRHFLENTRSPGTMALLRVREINDTVRFVPATQPGGQTLDAVLLLGALLYQGEHLGDGLRKELRQLAEDASHTGKLDALEDPCMDLLSLGKRLDWGQLCQLTRITESTATLAEFARLARAVPDAFPHIYAAALLTQSADAVADYLIRFGQEGLMDLKEALALGKGAVDILLKRQVAINRDGIAQGWNGVAAIALQFPTLGLIVRYLGFLLGSFLVFHGLERCLFDPVSKSGDKLPRMKNVVLGVITALMFILGTEPFLIKPPSMTAFNITMSVPVISALGDPGSLSNVKPTFNMDLNTLLSIGFFLLLQVSMYLICLWKISTIDKQPLNPLIKLRLMENEENLFDGGLYVGIAGTASALVLQVLNVIDPNLLAAYSSNLFGIICVALVKIRHVRPYKYRLIMEGQQQIAKG